MQTNGYILHSFSRYLEGKCQVYIIGRLENGQTFGIVEDRFMPFFYIRVSENHTAQKVLSKSGTAAYETNQFSMDGEKLLRIQTANPEHIKKVAGELAKAKVRTYEADVKVEQQFLMNLGLRSLCRIKGHYTAGKGVDQLYKNPELSPVDSSISLKSLVLEPYFQNDRLISFTLCSLPEEDTVEVIDNFTSDKEFEVLQKLRETILTVDPDIICAWRIQQNCFLPIKKRFEKHNMPFDLGRHRPGKWFIQKGFRGKEFSILQGRQLLDIEELMDHTWERYPESTPESI